MGKPWFAPKQFGYGSGLPISWEGWMVLIGFFAALFALLHFSQALLPPRDALLARIIGIAVLVTILVIVARAKTEGGWRWRNGRD